MAELDRLYYSLGLDTSGLEKGINKAIKDFSQLSTQISQKVKKLNDSYIHLKYEVINDTIID